MMREPYQSLHTTTRAVLADNPQLRVNGNSLNEHIDILRPRFFSLVHGLDFVNEVLN